MDGEYCGMDIFGITSSKLEIISLLGNIDREGMGNVITYLVRSDYFTAHCHHHHRYKGGLADHSLGVYYEMIDMAPHLPDESCRIVALLHDLCTSHLDGYDEIGHNHHGQRSVDLLDTLGFKLLDEERMAIANHMHHVPSSKMDETTELWHILHACDRKNANEQSNSGIFF